MPLRSPKMKRRILGFQRRVWWPKCTPASSSSLIPTWAIGASLSLPLFPPDAGGLGADAPSRAPSVDPGGVARFLANRSVGRKFSVRLAFGQMKVEGFPPRPPTFSDAAPIPYRPAGVASAGGRFPPEGRRGGSPGGRLPPL